MYRGHVQRTCTLKSQKAIPKVQLPGENETEPVYLKSTTKQTVAPTGSYLKVPGLLPQLQNIEYPHLPVFINTDRENGRYISDLQKHCKDIKVSPPQREITTP
jgi:hypothetical protein